MNRSLLVVVVALLIGFASNQAFAKRQPPAEVAPVRQGTLEFRVRHQLGGGYLPGFVEAWDTTKNQQVWLRQIYVIRRKPDLEQDVQDVFVTGLKLIADRNALEISNERGGVFELNLETLEVKTLKGQSVVAVAAAAPPSFFSIGGDVYHANDRFEAEKQPLKLNAGPRWFAGFPKEVTRPQYEAWELQLLQQGKSSRQESADGERVYQIPTQPPYPNSLDAVRLQDQGATLQMTAVAGEASGADEVFLELTLSAGERAIEREVEHRRTNVLPFLFAFTADGKPVTREARGGIEQGGSNRFVELVAAKSRKSWTLRIANESLASVLPAEAREASVVAVFSERQHENYEPGGPVALGEVWSSDALKKRPPQIVVRSNEVLLRKSDAKWEAVVSQR